MSPITRKQSKRSNYDSDSSDSDSSYSSSSRVPILTGSNYPIWKNKMRSYLMTKGCWDSATVEVNQSDKSDKNQQKALGYILKFLDQATADGLMEEKDMTPYKAWKKLEATASKTTKIMNRNIKNQINRFMWEGKSVDKNYRRFKHLINKYNASGGIALPDKEQLECLLANIPRRYEQTADQLLDDDTTTLEEAFAKLALKEERINQATKNFQDSKKDKARKHKGRSKGKFSRTEQNEKAFNCAFCKMDNHETKQCWKKAKADKAKSDKGKKPLALNVDDITAQLTQIVKDHLSKSEEVAALMTTTNMSDSDENRNESAWHTNSEDTVRRVDFPQLNSKRANEEVYEANVEQYQTKVLQEEEDRMVWILDSGATRHMTNTSTNLSHYQNVENAYVSVADGNWIQIVGKGELIVACCWYSTKC